MMNKCKSIRLHHDGAAESNLDRDCFTAQMDETLAGEIYYREREPDPGPGPITAETRCTAQEMPRDKCRASAAVCTYTNIPTLYRTYNVLFVTTHL